MGLAYQGQDIVFRFIIEYNNLRDLKVLTLKAILFIKKIQPQINLYFPKVLTLELVPTSQNKIYEQYTFGTWSTKEISRREREELSFFLLI